MDIMTEKYKLYITAVALILITAFASCRKEERIVPSESTDVTEGEQGEIAGFFLLNEGNMGSNKSTLDYFNYVSGVYTKNIYAERNPGVVKELGDVGNDLQIYGSKLYAVVNCSNFVEVMDARTAKHITQISIPNCRYITFRNGYAYVSSYAGPVQIDPNARLGYVAKIDTVTMKVVAECIVGYQPEEMAISGDKLYVANSGGYRVPDYDRTVSVIDLSTFTEKKKIEVAANLHRMEIDSYGQIWVSSRGDYYETPSRTYVIDSKTDEVTYEFKLLSNSGMALAGDSLYIYGTEWNYTTQENKISYAIVNVRTKKIVTRNFITDGTEKQIKIPYGIAVHPHTREIFVTDAGDYVTPGKLYCFTAEGRLKWSVETGDIPAHIAFTRIPLEEM